MSMEPRLECVGGGLGEETVTQAAQVADGTRYRGPRSITRRVWVQADVVGGEVAVISWHHRPRAACQALPLTNDTERAEHRAQQSVFLILCHSGQLTLITIISPTG